MFGFQPFKTNNFAVCIEFKTVILQRNVCNGLKSVLYALEIKKLVNSKRKRLYTFFDAYLSHTLVFFIPCLTVLNLNLRALVSRLLIVHSRRYWRGSGRLHSVCFRSFFRRSLPRKRVSVVRSRRYFIILWWHYRRTISPDTIGTRVCVCVRKAGA